MQNQISNGINTMRVACGSTSVHMYNTLKAAPVQRGPYLCWFCRSCDGPGSGWRCGTGTCPCCRRVNLKATNTKRLFTIAQAMRCALLTSARLHRSTSLNIQKITSNGGQFILRVIYVL